MKEEGQSIFDEFETDEETGEVMIPRATVGVAPDLDGVSSAPAVEEETPEESAAKEASDEELPVLQFDFNFGEEELADTSQVSEEDIVLQGIDEALAAQMAASLGPEEPAQDVQNGKKKKEPKKRKEAKGKTEPKKKRNLWTRIPLWCRITMISVCSLCLVCGLLIGTKPGRNIIYGLVADYIHWRADTEDDVTPYPQLTMTPEPPKPTDTPQNPLTPGPTEGPTPTVKPRKEEYCYNILLIGEEALEYFGGSRSDTMIILSVNSKEKKMHMTSLMRDMYVQIPGYADNKLNAAYSFGGTQLLIETVELNFQVKIDGYVKVGFDDFEWIIDRLGGVEITLTAEEAEYLRTTRYITNPDYRNVVAGTQRMNGNQVLGYCRVRYVPTANGTHSDFGRTERQRSVLMKLFNQYKDSNIFSLLSILNDCLPKVKTNISRDDMQDLLQTVVENRMLSMDTLRIPIAGTFEDARVGKSEVIQVKWPKNLEVLHEFIFGPEE